MTHAKGGATLDGATYTVDNAGNRTAKSDLYAGVTTNYDNIYELLSATQGGTTAESYIYDPVGNRLTALGSATWSYNTSNELNSRPGASYAYDANGNTIVKTDGTGSTSYTWDYENRMTSVILPGSGGTVSFLYDPFGRRIYKTSSSGTSIYAYDGDNLVEETNSSGSAVARYSQGLNIDEPLALLRSATTSYYQADGLGSVTSLTNAAGAAAQTYTYDSFGNIVATTGSLTNSFRYTGREFDTETSLYYYRARYYDPTSGRFLGEDPIRYDSDDINFYAYADNNPNIFGDPDGLRPRDHRKYDCSLFGGCSKKPFGPPGAVRPGCPCKTGARLPDLVNLSVSVTVPWTGGWGSWTFSVSADRFGNWYWSPIGPGIGRSPTIASVTLTPNYMLQKCKPSADELSNLISGHGFSGAAGYWGGATVSCNKSGCSAGAGLVTPQAGGNYSYSFQGPGNTGVHW